MKKDNLKDYNPHTPYVCPKCGASGSYGTGGNVEIATGNMVPFEYYCHKCGHTWGNNSQLKKED